MKESPNYYAIVPADVRYHPDLSANAKLLYGEITALCGKNGSCWAANDYFADLYGKSKRTVSRWISQLEKLGFIRVNVIRSETTKEVEKREIFIVSAAEKRAGTPHDKNVRPHDKNVFDGQKCHDPHDKNVMTPPDKNVAPLMTFLSNRIIQEGILQEGILQEDNKDFSSENFSSDSLADTPPISAAPPLQDSAGGGSAGELPPPLARLTEKSWIPDEVVTGTLAIYDWAGEHDKNIDFTSLATHTRNIPAENVDAMRSITAHILEWEKPQSLPAVTDCVRAFLDDLPDFWKDSFSLPAIARNMATVINQITADRKKKKQEKTKNGLPARHFKSGTTGRPAGASKKQSTW